MSVGSQEFLLYVYILETDGPAVYKVKMVPREQIVVSEPRTTIGDLETLEF